MQKNPSIYRDRKHIKEWFLRLIAFLLFHREEISFTIGSHDHVAEGAMLTMTKPDPHLNKIVLEIRRDMPRHHPNPRSMADLADLVETRTCTMEFAGRGKHTAPYSLLSMLYSMMDRYRFPLQYRGDANLCERIVMAMRHLYYRDERTFTSDFCDYPVDFEKIVHNARGHPMPSQRRFLECLQETLGMRPFPQRQDRQQRIAFEDFMDRYTENEELENTINRMKMLQNA